MKLLILYIYIYCIMLCYKLDVNCIYNDNILYLITLIIINKSSSHRWNNIIRIYVYIYI
jgi:hypothetical protein